MKKQRGWIAAVAAVGLIAAGCGDSTGPGDPLSEAEAGELAAAMTGTASTVANEEFGGTQSPNVTPGGSSALEVTTIENLPFGGPHACEAGGVVDVSGSLDFTYDDQTQVATASVTAELAQNDCVLEGKEHTFTTNGDPHLDFTAELRSEAGQPSGEQTVTLAGAFTWEDDSDRSGRCEVDLTGVFQPDTNTRVVEGTFCGHTLEVEVQLGTG